MPLGWNEIKGRAMKFSREWAEEAFNKARKAHRKRATEEVQ